MPLKEVVKLFGIGFAHGKFGELLQGVLPENNTNFLVTLPISRYSIAKFSCSALEETNIVYPSHKAKSAQLVSKIMEYFGITYGWILTIDSELQEGKGLGSSTADMVASARAVTQALGKDLPIEVLLRFLKEIEPSDGVMYDGIVCFYHQNVVLHSQLGYLSDLMIVAIDEGGIVDTVKFNREIKLYSQEEKQEYVNLLNEMLVAIKKADLKRIGSIASKSAILHQATNPKKNLNLLLELCKVVDALGVVVAHSGTYIGIILDKKNPDHSKKLSCIERSLKMNSLIPERFNTFSKQMEYPDQIEDRLKVGNVY